MGDIREIGTDRTLVLEPEHLVGRASNCALRLDERHVSGQHALIRWRGSGWEVKDLGSRNGTFLDDVRLTPGEERSFPVGSKVAFGKLESRWELVDDSAPRIMAVPIDGGKAVLADGELLALPSPDDPRATIYPDAEGNWVLEQPELSGPIRNQQVFEVDRKQWRFSCPENLSRTSLADTSPDLAVRYLGLSFSVSRDEEHVELLVTCGAASFNLGARGHNYLLLTLARRRLADEADGLPETSCGWVYLEDLAHDPSMAPPQLNIDVFRIRKQFADLGVIDAANVIERRARTRQLRIGPSRITIVVL